MKKLTILTIAIMTIMSACNNNSKNPFFAEQWDTPYGVQPFSQIKFEHYRPAFDEGMKRHKAEIEAIVNNADEPTFENTIVAFDASGLFLERVAMTFFALISSDRTDSLLALEAEIAPALSKHSDEIAMSPKLFNRIKAVYDNKESLNLQGEDAMLLEKIYKNFVRGGANLDEQAKADLMKINEELSLLSTEYSKNAQNDNNAFRLTVDKEADLAGLPEGSIAAAAELAKTEGQEGKWLFTLDQPSRVPFLTYADNRDLRQKMFEGYANKGNNNDANDNKKIAAKIASLELKKAKIFGFETAAGFILDDRMAKTPEAVKTFLDGLWAPTQIVTDKEAKELQAMIDAEKGGFKLAPWDWWYYAEKVKKSKYNFDETEFSEYLQLENVVKGCFDLTTKLWGLQYEERFDIPRFNNDENKAYIVKDADGTELAVFIADYHPRASKRQGAWMTNLREQSGYSDNNVMPIVINVCNFTPPTGGKPALLSIDETETLFHEFGHALHGMLSKCKYRSLAGTNVKRDFVELPSQVMENWALNPEVLKTYAKHYETGEIVPDTLIEKMERASKFNQGFATTEFLAAALLDYYWYTLTDEAEQNTAEFEKEAMGKIKLTDKIIPRYRSTYFTHIFGGGYAMGYYSYIWAEVLDADAFEAFVETGDIYNQDVAKRFRETVLSKGGTVDPMELYKQFRGQEPNPEALLRNRGLK
ncbi:MAG: M3 family metallopeptidase [Bacteroidales bacterium]|jgi:peptidyl-dipeptidase Dcp|nr:M3 family metallopeptidase [Bacteroidales bacterium]